VSDIYDALSASDRPYKKALPPEKALDILSIEANRNLIDRSLFRLFVEAEIFKRTMGWKHPAAP
jgi:HD-GYP domain-containing protein (c-di-GMP phosphodiesterase class II)